MDSNRWNLDMDYDSDSMSMASAPPSPTSTDAGPHDNISMRSASPSSIWSMTSSLQQASFREEYGRRLNNFSEIYNLPTDEEEYARQKHQHESLIRVTGTKYVPPMAEVLTPEYEGDSKACLELGFGTGAWLVQAAKDFPHVEFVGVDLVPIDITEDEMPSNCRAEVDDVNLGLQHFYGSFDVVHVRLLSAGIRDYKNLIDEISHVLRPGGLIDLSETDLSVYDQNFQRFEFSQGSEAGPPWFARFLCLVHEATTAIGGSASAAVHIYDWVKKHPSFESVSFNEYWIPGSAWRSNLGYIREPESHTLEGGLKYIDSSRPLLLKRGYEESFVDKLSVMAKAELIEGRTPCFARLFSVHARKIKRHPEGEGTGIDN